MTFLNNFDTEQLDAAAILLADDDFKVIVHYISEEVTNLSLKSVQFVGEGGDKIKGACIALQELRDQIILSRETIGALEEARETAEYRGDAISP